MASDNDMQAQFLARKIIALRIFEDENGKMNRSVLDVDGATIIVSQFTLSGDTSRGNRPGFSRAAGPVEGKRLYEQFSRMVREQGISVQMGRFGADMKVHLINDGPVTIWLDTSN